MKNTYSIWLVVLAGGSGTRFWPRSRQGRPKQLLSVLGEGKSLLQNTLDRFSSFVQEEKTLVLATKPLENAIAADLKGFSGKIFCEPSARNTAPAITMAMEYIRARDPNSVVLVVPSDHWIGDSSTYTSVLREVSVLAQKHNVLFTLGVRPSRPATGYGYIATGAPFEEKHPFPVFQVERFVEKPDTENAKVFYTSGNYLWNIGIFVWTLDCFFQEMGRHASELLHAFVPYRKALEKGGDGEKEGKLAHAACSIISIDYALMEKSKRVAVVPGDFHWKDLGSFDSLYELYPACEGGVGKVKDAIAIDATSNLLHVPSKTVALLGVENLFVIETEDVLLIGKREEGERVKEFISRLQKESNKKHLL